MEIDEKLNSKTTYMAESNRVFLYNIPLGNHNIKIKYTYKTEEVLQQFDNATVLRINNDAGYGIEATYKILLPENSSFFKTNNRKAKVYKINNNEYSIEISKRIFFDEFIEVKMDKGIVEEGKVINEEIESHKFLELFDNEKMKGFNILSICGFLSVMLWVVVIMLTRRIKVTEYVREPELLLDPIISESIIDGKIGAKELIMSCIVELICRKRLKNIGNDAIEIVDLNQISEYEKEIVEMIFNGKKRIAFAEIKEVFLNEAKETKRFYEKFKNLKEKIEEKIYNYNIYSRVGDRILKIIKALSFFILIILGYLLSNSVFSWNLLQYGQTVAIALIFYIINRIFKRIGNKGKKINIKVNGIGLPIVLAGIPLLGLMILSIIILAREYLIIILMNLVIAIINIIIIRKTKLHVYTKLGKSEYANAVGLKQYIEDYGLMRQRDLDSVLIWDEYLAYAVAFGIPNKVIRKFSENLMEANIIIQKIDYFLGG